MLLKSLSGKTAIVTGANKGMGYEISLALANRKAKVIMADKQDQTKATKRIKRITCNENIESNHLDLASLNSIRCFADEIKKKEEKIDILVNNAGIFCLDKCKTEDGLDGVMQTNHLGPFLLTNLLVELLKKGQDSRIVFVSSNGAFFHNMTVQKLTQPNYFEPHYVSGAIHYYNSKLCNMITSKMLAERLSKFKVTSNAVHPGMASTDFMVSNANKLKKDLTLAILKRTTKDVKDAADVTTFVATSESIKHVSGKYFVDYQIRKVPKCVEDEKFCRDIWNESLKLVKLHDEVI